MLILKTNSWYIFKQTEVLAGNYPWISMLNPSPKSCMQALGDMEPIYAKKVFNYCESCHGELYCKTGLLETWLPMDFEMPRFHANPRECGGESTIWLIPTIVTLWEMSLEMKHHNRTRTFNVIVMFLSIITTTTTTSFSIQYSLLYYCRHHHHQPNNNDNNDNIAIIIIIIILIIIHLIVLIPILIITLHSSLLTQITNL